MTICNCYCSLYIFGGYGPHVEDYLHDSGSEFFWDAVSQFVLLSSICINVAASFILTCYGSVKRIRTLHGWQHFFCGGL